MQQKEEKSLVGRIRDRVTKRGKVTEETSDRFSRLGYLQYPKRAQLDIRIATLIEILEEIETEIDELSQAKTDREKYAIKSKNIFKLFRAFKIVGSPWMRGLDNRELAHKVKIFFRLESQIGHLPAFFPDLKFCTEILLHLSWMAVDVASETPVLFETKTTVQPTGIRIEKGEETFG